MGLFDHFPYTNVHELNLDWILSMMKALEAEWEAFTAGNSLTFSDPLLHDMTKTYAKNTIVLDSNGNAYVSLQAVPVGVALSNQDYWLMVFDYEAFIEKVNKNFTVRYYRDQYRATTAMAIGDWLTVDDVLCKATAAIAVDDVLELGVNIEHFTLEDFINSFTTSVTQTINNWRIQMTNTINQYKNDIDASELAYQAAMQAEVDRILAGATVDSEVIDARTDNDGNTYTTLGNALRGQIKIIEDLFEGTNDNELIPFELWHAIQNNGNPGTVVDWQNPASVAAINCAAVDCSAGDVFTLFGTGFDSGRLWAFLDGDSKIINKSASNLSAPSDGLVITAPTNAAKLIINSNTPVAIKGNTINYRANRSIYVKPEGAFTGAIATIIPDLNDALPNVLYRVAAGTDAQIPANTPAWVTRGFFTILLEFYYGTNNANTFYRQIIINAASSGISAYRDYTNSTWGSWNKVRSYWIVDKNGHGDFATITDAVDNSADGDTILIMPGRYNESVKMFGKNRNLIGVSMDLCMLYYGSGLYADPALEANIGVIKNLTIISGNDDALAEDSATRKAYGVHIEHAESSKFSITFENCFISSALNAGAGIGCRYNQTVTFRNCVLKTVATIVYSSEINDFITSAGLLFHNDGTPDLLTSDGHLKLDNCEIIGVSKAIMAQSLENGNTMDVRFNKCLAYIDNEDTNDVVGYWGTGAGAAKGVSPYFCGSDIILSGLSYGNNSPEIDFSNYWN